MEGIKKKKWQSGKEAEQKVYISFATLLLRSL
jgi:hypothetical protein